MSDEISVCGFPAEEAHGRIIMLVMILFSIINEHGTANDDNNFARELYFL